MTEDEMVGSHRLNGCEFEQTPGDGEGQGSLVCCSPWVAKSWTQLSDFVVTLCEPMDCSMPDFPVLHHFLELAQTHVH